MSRSITVLAATLLLASCSADELTEIVVVVDSNLTVPGEIDAVRVDVTAGGSTSSSQGNLTGRASRPLPRIVNLLHTEGPLGPVDVRATALIAGREVVSRDATVSFQKGRSLVLRMNLDRECIGVVCGAGETCARGSCRNVQVAPGELVEWPGFIPPPDGGPPGCPMVPERCNTIDDDCDGLVDEDFDLDVDPINCGRCSNVCSSAGGTPACVASMCTIACNPGFADCNDNTTDGCEADLTSPRTCGACDNRCPTGPGMVGTCDMGVCGAPTCAPAMGDCDGDMANGCETPLDTLADCGACGTACAPANATGTCATATCAVDTCDAGFEDCDADATNGCEASLSTDTANCGSCGMACAAGESCSGGTCRMPDPALQTAGGGAFTCARRTSGAVVCWGENGDGQLGDGSTMDSTTFVPTMGITDATWIAAGDRHACAVTAMGDVMCWGRNNQGQLGDGSRTGRSTPVMVGGIASAVRVGAGGQHSCAVRMTGAVECWGLNLAGQLGNGGGGRETSPVTVTGLTGAVEVAAGIAHSCAVLTGGGVACWGANGAGQLGDGTTTDRRTFVMASGLSDATAIAAGGNHTCAVRTGGGVSCWGENADGQLGVGGGDRDVPTDVTGLTAATHVACGASHSCARRSNDLVFCWGDDRFEQLGNGAAGSDFMPGVVRRLTDAAEVTAGAFHGCAATLTGGVSCWGENGAGQLGTGDTTSSSIATSALGLP